MNNQWINVQRVEDVISTASKRETEVMKRLDKLMREKNLTAEHSTQ